MNDAISRRTLMTAAAAMLPARAKQSFAARMGLQIYSLRYEAQKNLPATLDLIRKLGFTEVEVGDFYGHTATEFRQMLDRAGLHASSMGADYERFAKAIGAVREEAHTLGVEYIVCSTLPHGKQFTTEECKRGAGDFNKWAERLVGSGLGFCYHTHGFEFGPSSDGTLFDTLMKSTDPKLVKFEMDIFWIVFGNQDPVTLLQRYPGRFPLMHVKDMRKDTVRNGRPGDVTEDASVSLGTGAVNIRAALSAAQKAGVRHYYLEDEAVDAVGQIPRSMRYLDSLHL